MLVPVPVEPAQHLPLSPCLALRLRVARRRARSPRRCSALALYERDTDAFELRYARSISTFRRFRAKFEGPAVWSEDRWVLYGREADRDRIGALLKGARESGSAALVVRGEPGIGTTALMDDTRERASDMEVLTARPVESESELPFAGLHQLIGGAVGRVDRLPGPQAAALRVALGLET